MSLRPKQATTRHQLLEAAAEIFAEIGFQNATVRQICEKAGANVAAVNYHFRDKEGLYAAVLVETGKASIEKYPLTNGLTPTATPQAKLRAFIRSFLLRIFSEGPIARYGKMMAREMVEPTAALDTIIDQNIRPMATMLQEIVAELLSTDADSKSARMCSISVVSQILFYHHCKPAIARLFPDAHLDKDSIEELTDHIHEFSLAAIQKFARRKK